LGSSLPAASPLDTALKKITLIEMAAPILAFASVVWEAIFGHHHHLQFKDRWWEQNLLLNLPASFGRAIHLSCPYWCQLGVSIELTLTASAPTGLLF